MDYGILIVVMIFLAFATDFCAECCNIVSLLTRTTTPKEFVGYFDETKYLQSRQYAFAKSKATLCKLVFDTVTLFGFWGLGGFAWLDEYVRTFGLGTIPTGLSYVGILVVVASLLSLPFAAYDTFVTEERFGFNKTTLQTFIRDKVLALVIVLVAMGIVLSSVFWLFLHAGAWAWVDAWMAVAAFMLVTSFVAPVLIAPLFLKFTPLPDGELKDEIFELAAKLDFPVCGVYVVDGSRRSSKANAFFTGIGKNKRIALFDTLIEKHTVPELLAVLAHEIRHNKKGHVLTQMIWGIASAGMTFFLLSLFLKEPAFFRLFGNVEPSVYTGFVLFSVAFGPIQKILGVLEKAFSRKCEYEADAFSAGAVGGPDGLIAGLKKLGTDGLANLTLHPFYVFLNYGHPPLIERIDALRALQRKTTRQTGCLD